MQSQPSDREREKTYDMAEMTYRTKYFVTQGSEDYRIAVAVRAVVDMLNGRVETKVKPCGNRNMWGDLCALPVGHSGHHAATNAAGAVCVEWAVDSRAARLSATERP